MTNDESEIRRLEAFCESASKGERTAGDIEHFITTALAAEREQHARDVHLAFIEGRDGAIDNAAMKAYDMGRPDIREAINALVPDRHSHTTCGGCPPSPVPPGGINQGSGAGEASERDRYRDALQAIGRGDEGRCIWNGINQDVHDVACEVAGYPPPSPASPTGETRNEAPPAAETVRGGSATIARFDSSESPASAPGGAPGVETACGRCGGHLTRTGDRSWCHYCYGTRGPTGTTPTPSTETPAAPTTGGRGRG